ncbi:unnamed protein product [Withania somnifera]
MAIITEEPDSPTPQKQQKPTSKPPQSTIPIPTKTTNATNPFHFWFYFTISVSLVTLIFMIITSLYPQDPKTWFLSLPPNLRQHYSKGRNIKVQTTPNQPQIEVFLSKKDHLSLLIMYLFHSGGRWPQEHNSEEIAENIYQFVSSLPKSVKQTEEEPVPKHIQKMFDEAQSGDHHHHHGHDHGHGHAHAGYMDAYGLGEGWAM